MGSCAGIAAVPVLAGGGIGITTIVGDAAPPRPSAPVPSPPPPIGGGLYVP